jgi:hypothetical protein
MGASFAYIDKTRTKRTFTLGGTSLATQISGDDEAHSPEDLSIAAIDDIQGAIMHQFEAEFENQFTANIPVGNVVTGADWGSDTNNPIPNLNEAISAVKKASGLKPTHLYVRQAGYDALLGNTNVENYISSRNRSFIMQDPTGEYEAIRGLKIVIAPETIQDNAGNELTKFIDTEAYLAYMGPSYNTSSIYMAYGNQSKQLSNDSTLLTRPTAAMPVKPLMFKKLKDETKGGSLHIYGEHDFLPVVKRSTALAKITGITV